MTQAVRVEIAVMEIDEISASDEYENGIPEGFVVEDPTHWAVTDLRALAAIDPQRWPILDRSQWVF